MPAKKQLTQSNKMNSTQIKLALSKFDPATPLHDINASEFQAGGAITSACGLAGYDEAGEKAVNQISGWSMSVAELEVFLVGQLD